jgi:hypothetical protein
MSYRNAGSQQQSVKVRLEGHATRCVAQQENGSMPLIAISLSDR